ncbi:FlaG protein [compost metagenome]
MDVGNIVSLVAPNRAANAAPTTDTRTRAGEAGQADGVPRKRLDSAVSDIQSFVHALRRNLNFSIDESTGQVVVKVIDSDSGKVVRQMPSEDVLKLAARLEDMRSLMFETHA